MINQDLLHSKTVKLHSPLVPFDPLMSSIFSICAAEFLDYCKRHLHNHTFANSLVAIKGPLLFGFKVLKFRKLNLHCRWMILILGNSCIISFAFQTYFCAVEIL